MQLTPMVLTAVAPFNSARVGIAGNYFRLVAAAQPVTVRLYRKGRPFAEAGGILAGYWSAPTEGFDEVEVTTTAAQTVIVGTIVGTGGYDRAAGDVNVTGSTGAVETKGPRVLTGAPLATDLPVLTRDIGGAPSANYVSGTLLAAGGSSAVFVAGSNTNGAIVWSASAVTCAAGLTRMHLLCKATAPTSGGDGLLIFFVQTIAAGVVNAALRLEKARFIPAGLGLYWFSDALESNALRFTDYTLL